MPRYVALSVVTILRIFITYKPAPFFGILSLIALVAGLISIVRFLVLFCLGRGEGHVQSLVLGANRRVVCSPPAGRSDCRSHRHEQTAFGGYSREDIASGSALAAGDANPNAQPFSPRLSALRVWQNNPMQSREAPL